MKFGSLLPNLAILLSLFTATLAAACGNSSEVSFLRGTPVSSSGRLAHALAQLDQRAEDLWAQSGVPGMAVAVVHGDRLVYAKGFGTRQVGRPERVDADTVFALASMSKPLGASVVASQVAQGVVSWDTPMHELLPWFALADSSSTARVTIGDLYAHRSGVPDHAGDTLEELGYDRDTILRQLRWLPLHPLGTFDYTNYGMTAAAVAVAQSAQKDWADLCEESLYAPLGMNSTSSRFSDFLS